MSSNQALADQTDAFLLGKLSGPEHDAMQSALAADPALAEEMALQADIVKGLQTARAAQLKARLAAIPVAGASATLPRWQVGALAVATAVMVVGGIYLYNEVGRPESQPESPFATVQTAPTSPLPTAEPTPDPGAAPAGEPAIAQSNPQSATPQAEGGSPANTANAITSMDAATVASVTVTEKTKAARGASGGAPDMAGVQASDKQTAKNTVTHAGSSAVERAVTNITASARGTGRRARRTPAIDNPDVEAAQLTTGKQDLEALPSGSIVTRDEVKTKPELIMRQADALAYQYYDNKIFLYGSFGDAIYELIELNTRKAGKRELYVYFKEQFYKVDDNVRQITPLQPITDEALVAELTLLRKKKVE